MTPDAAASVVRLGLGCMRLSTDPQRDEARAAATIHAALDAGVRVFDTARAYGRDDGDLGHNERLLARAVASYPRGAAARIVTKGGMRRPDGAWRPDGRARTLLADAEASASMLGRPPDLWLLHAPDPRTPWTTSLRAVATIAERGLARAVGVSNVTRAQLEEAIAAVPIGAVEVALGAFDDTALRGGIVELCTARGIPLFAHSPLGGPARAARLAADRVLAALAAARGVTAQQIVLAWLLDLSPFVVPLPGARTPSSARAAAAAAGVVLDDDERARLAERFRASALARPRARTAPATTAGEVVLIMGIPGAGKSRAVAAWTARGYTRLNRDERGGSLRDLAEALEELLDAGARRVVLDNTYVTRAARADVIDAAWRRGIAVRCIWLDTPAVIAQVNLCARLVDVLGTLPAPEDLRHSRRPGVLSPTQHLRLVRELEPPAGDEGFSAVETVSFARASSPGLGPGIVCAVDDAEEACSIAKATTAILVLGWRPGATPDDEASLTAQLRGQLDRDLDVALCPHPGGPPICWCRPPLPGAVVAWARARGVDLARILVLEGNPTFRSLARAFPVTIDPAT